MPIYEYKCDSCKNTYEHSQTGFNPVDSMSCPGECGGLAKRLTNTSFTIIISDPWERIMRHEAALRSSFDSI